MDNEEFDALEIRQYLLLLRRWLWLIVLAALLAAGAALVASQLSTPIYEATTTLLISEGQKATGPDYNALLISERLAQTYAQMLQGRPVIDEAAQRLGLPTDEKALTALSAAVSVTPVADTQLVRLRVRHADPELAAQLANTIPVVFADLNTRTQTARFDESLQSLNEEMQRLEGEIDATQQELDGLKVSGDSNGQQARLETLLAQYRATYAGLLSSYEEIRTAQAREMDSVTVYEAARVPAVPFSPRTRTNMLLAALAGAALAVGGAFAMEYLDDTVKRPEDVEHAVGLTTYAAIARFTEGVRDGRPLMADEPTSAVAEAYRMLRTNVEFAAVGLESPGVVLVVTSAQAGEGKSTTAANLAIALAQVGKRVVLVDCDLRRPTQHKAFDLPNLTGLTSLYLRSDMEPQAALQEVGVRGLQVLTSGPLPSNSVEVLGFPQTERVLKRLRELADYVVLDAPPVLGVADATILAQKAHGLLLVAEAGQTRTEVLQRAVAALRGVEARLLGVVLNRVTPRSGGYYHYYYDAEGERRKRDRRASAVGLVRRLGRRGALVLASAALLLAVALGVLWLGYNGAAEAGAALPSVAPTLQALAPTAVVLPAALSSPTLGAMEVAEPAEGETPMPAGPIATLLEPTVAPVAPDTTPSLQPSPTPAELPHGVGARLRLRDDRSEYAAGEPVYFVLQVQNNADEMASMGFIGLDVPGLPFHTTWSQVDLGSGADYSGEDQMVFSAPGTYTVHIAACFSDVAACLELGSGDWATYPESVTVTIH